MESGTSSENPASRGELRTLAALFLRLGLTAFGGPAAHIGMMHDEVVTRRKWITDGEFLDMIALCNLIPGPNSTELAIHIGYRRARLSGLLVAGACFILPAAILCTIIAALYVRYGQLPVSEGILYGVKPVVIAIIAQAVYKLARSVLKSPLLAAVATLAAVANFFYGHELIILFAAAVAVFLFEFPRRRFIQLPAFLPWSPSTLALAATTTAAATTAAATPAALLPLFLVFLKIGSVLFGSGYVLVAFLQADLVDRFHWLTQTQLLDAVAVGQFTPGPVFTTATFIGYIVSGPMGALVATLGIFLPAFFFVAITAPLMPRLRNSKTAAAFLDGLNAASLALMAVVTIHLTMATLFPKNTPDFVACILAAASLVLLLWRKNINSAWLVLAGGLIGIALNYR